MRVPYRARGGMWNGRPTPAASGEFEIGRCGLAALHGNLVADLLAFVKAAKTRRLHGCDVDKHVLAAVLRHDEAETLGRVEPLDCTDSHRLRHPRLVHSATTRGAGRQPA